MNIEISNSVFGRNRASGYAASGGGICLQGRGVRCALTESVSFTMNSARLDGGAMHISDQASTTIHKATFVGNEAMNGGGAALFVLVSLCSMFAISDVLSMASQSLERTRASTLSVTVTETKFLFNRALYSSRGGGCVAAVGFGSNVTVSRCSFKGNDAGRGSGGALYAFSGPIVNIDSSDFGGNKAERGGALYAEVVSPFSADGSRVCPWLS